MLSGDYKTNVLLYLAGDPLLTLRSKTWNGKEKKKTHRHKHELIRNLLVSSSATFRAEGSDPCTALKGPE